jgi:hypothetical protein
VVVNSRWIYLDFPGFPLPPHQFLRLSTIQYIIIGIAVVVFVFLVSYITILCFDSYLEKKENKEETERWVKERNKYYLNQKKMNNCQNNNNNNNNSDNNDDIISSSNNSDVSKNVSDGNEEERKEEKNNVSFKENSVKEEEVKIFNPKSIYFVKNNEIELMEISEENNENYNDGRVSCEENDNDDGVDNDIGKNVKRESKNIDVDIEIEEILIKPV